MKVRASQLNGCAYCVDLHVRLALKASSAIKMSLAEPLAHHAVHSIGSDQVARRERAPRNRRDRHLFHIDRGGSCALHHLCTRATRLVE